MLPSSSEVSIHLSSPGNDQNGLTRLAESALKTNHHKSILAEIPEKLLNKWSRRGNFNTLNNSTAYQVAKRLKSCVYKFYSCVNLKIVFQSTRCIKSFFPYKDRINRSQQSRVIYRANCWDCNGFYIGKTKRRLHDRKTEHFKALAKNDNTSAIADHVKATGHNIKWDHFDILAKGKTDYHCKIKETLYIQELEPAFNVNVGSEKLMLY